MLEENGKTLPLVTNHYSIEIPKCNLYHYHIKINYSDKSKNGDRINRKLKKSWNEVNFLILNTLSNNNSNFNELFYDQTYQRKIIFAFDGKENFYTCRPLRVEKEFKQNVPVNYNEKNYTFDVSIKFITILNLDNINESFTKSSNINTQDIERSLNVIFKNGLLSSSVPTLKAIYPKFDGNELENKNNSISLDKTAVFGHVQSVRILNKSVNLIIDRMVTAFYSTSSLTSYYNKQLKHLELSKSYNFNEKNQDTLRTLNKKINGLQVVTTHLQYQRKYKVYEITKELVRDLRFFDKLQKKSVGVCDYYKNKYNMTLNQTLPCLNVGAKNNPIYLPFEVCRIAPNQKTKELSLEESIELIKLSNTKKIEQRFELIQEKLNLIKLKNKVVLDEFFIKINKNPILTDGIQLVNPKLNYSNVENFQPNHGKWEMNNKKVLKSVNLKKNQLCIVNLTDSLNSEDINKFFKLLQIASKKIGIDIDNPFFYDKYSSQNSFKGEDVEDLKILLEEIIKFYSPLKPKLILFLISKAKGDKVYKNIKSQTEINYGLITQCILDKTIRIILGYYFIFDSISLLVKNSYKVEKIPLKENGEYILNTLILKINTKLGGINSTINSETSEISKLKEDLMVIGADVTHPSTMDKFSFSVCSVVASYDSDYFKYLNVVKIQETSKEEMIKQMYEIVLELLELVLRKKIEDLKSKGKNVNENDRNLIYSLLPQNILYYRDGVSEGQYNQLLEYEIKNMRKAFTQFSKERKFNKTYKPKINLIIVLKRHNSKFKILSKDKDISNSSKKNLFEAKKSVETFDLSSFSSSLLESKKNIANKDFEHTKTLNISPGTLVDDLKIVKSKNEFYLCSHSCDHGTIRPTHYDVLINESNYEMSEIQKFTYYLCYLFGKGTKSLSIPTPVKYAHLAAYRARTHLLVLNQTELKSINQSDQHLSFQNNLVYSKNLNNNIFIEQSNEPSNLEKDFQNYNTNQPLSVFSFSIEKYNNSKTPLIYNQENNHQSPFNRTTQINNFFLRKFNFPDLSNNFSNDISSCQNEIAKKLEKNQKKVFYEYLLKERNQNNTQVSPIDKSLQFFGSCVFSQKNINLDSQLSKNQQIGLKNKKISKKFKHIVKKDDKEKNQTKIDKNINEIQNAIKIQDNLKGSFYFL